MKHLVDLENFERKDSILFFQSFFEPNISITSEVECTGAKERARKHGVSFFFYYLHAMLKACNEIKEFKYRISPQGEVYYYDTIDTLAIIRTGENGAYNTLRLPYDSDLKQFAEKACTLIEKHKIHNYPFASTDKGVTDDDQGVFLVSAMPTLSFTGISFAHRGPVESYPLSLVGKMITREGKEYIPIGIKVNHAFIDGYHLDKFFTRVSELLKE